MKITLGVLSFLILVIFVTSFIPVFGENSNHTLTINADSKIVIECDKKSNNLGCDETTSKLNDLVGSINGITTQLTLERASNFKLAAISLGIGTIAATSAYLTAYFSRKQIDHLNEEKRHRLRPIIVRREYFPFRDGLLRPHHIQQDKILFRLMNQGPLPAINIVMEWYVAIMKNGERINIKSSTEHYPEGRPLPSLGPEESYSVDLFIDSIHYQHATESNNCAFGLIINYQDDNKIKYKYFMEGYFDYQGDLMLLNVEMSSDYNSKKH